MPKSLREEDVETFIWGAHTCLPECRGRVHRGVGLRETLTDSSLNRTLGTLEAFLTWAFRNGLVVGETIQPATARARTRVVRRLQLTAGQLTELVEGAADPYERVILALATYTGGRAGELRTVRLADVAVDAGEIDWTRHKTRGDDTLPIMAELEAELRRWFTTYEKEAGPLQPRWYLIPARRSVGTPGEIRYYPERPRAAGAHIIVKKHLARVLGVEESALRGEGVHTVRRSLARALYERLREDRHPDPIAVTQALLGHASRVMTERYIGVETGRQERDKLLRGRSVLRREP